MRTLSLSLTLSLLALPLAACSSDDDHHEEGVFTLDDASDEVAATILDRVDRGDATEDAAEAAYLVSPADGDTLAADTPGTLDWERPGGTLRHGRTTGDFVVLRIECDGHDEPLVVVGIESTDWTAPEDHWAEIVEAGGGPCAVEVVSAYVSDGVIEEGPFIPGDVPSFTIE